MSVPLLSPDQHWLVEAIAQRVVELLEERQTDAAGSRLVDASELAHILRISRSAVYEHAAELGAIEVGDGHRPRLRFDVKKARAAWTQRIPGERSDDPEPSLPIAIPRRRRRRATQSANELLPVKGQQAA